MKQFTRIAITPPEIRNEIIDRSIRILLDGKADLLHLRFPDATENEMRKVIEMIPQELYCRIKLHSYCHIIEEYGLRGFHYNGHSPVAKTNRGGISRSCHSIAEVEQCIDKGYEYVTLSPVYDSISKKGYPKNASLLRDVLPGGIAIMALGGVTEDKFGELEKHGFAGAAMIGNYFGYS